MGIAFEYGNYGGLLSYFPASRRFDIVLVFPVVIQLLCLALSYSYDRLRPLVYGASLPVLYLSGLTLYRLSIDWYHKVFKVAPSVQDSMTQKWEKVQKMLWVISQINLWHFILACLCLMVTRYAVGILWKKVGKQSLFSSWQESKGLMTKRITHGSAKICSEKHLHHLNQEDGLPIGGIVSSNHYDDPYLLAKDIENEASDCPILRLSFNHGLVIAPSGAGKGIGIIIPTLLDYQGSVVVTDIKGENYLVTAAHRRAQGRTVYAIDPFHLTGEQVTDDKQQSSLNVLELLQPQNESVVDDSATLAHLLCPPPSSGTAESSYFAKQAASVIQCLMLYVVCEKSIPYKDKNLSTVYDLLCQPQKVLEDLLETISEHKREMAFGTASRLANRVLGTESKELSSTLNTACSQLRFLESPEVRKCIQTSSVNLRELVEGRADLYLCIPSEKLEVQGHLLRLLTGVVFLKMQNARGQRAKMPLLFLLDEMPSLGRMPQIEQALVYGRGYGVRLLAISQTLEKLRTVYPGSWRTFLSSDVCLFFGSTEQEVAEYVSQRLGKKTVLSRGENLSYSQSRQDKNLTMPPSGSSSEQKGTSFSEAQRSLLSMDEVARLKPSVLTAFVIGEYPLLLQRLNHLTHPYYKGKYQSNILHG